jgi:DNA replication protein
VPARFLTELLPQISDSMELQVTFATFRIASDGKLRPPAASEKAILADEVLAKALGANRRNKDVGEVVRRGLKYAVARDSLIEVVVSSADGSAIWYVPNTEENRVALEESRTTGKFGNSSSGVAAKGVEIEITRPSLFSLYEKNIGLLTPLLTEQIVAAMQHYPVDWIEEAIGEAVSYNRRNWRYIQRILENWAASGKGSSPPGGKSDEANKRGADELLDPDQYREGRYLRRARKR